jgi:hypothetical protein
MAALPLKPPRPEFTDSHFPDIRCDVFAAQLLDLDRVGELLRVTLRGEPALTGLPVVRLAVPDSVKRLPLLVLYGSIVAMTTRPAHYG